MPSPIYSEEPVQELPAQINHPLHAHVLNRDFNDNGWRCDGFKRSGGCRRGITKFNQTSGVSRWRCQQCDYDLCDKCAGDKAAP